jgi:alkylation response protein AidB-like acyl-CoA dehydrogenase
VTDTTSIALPLSSTPPSPLRQHVDDFVQEHVVPHVARMETAGAHTNRVMAPLLGGWFGLHVGSEHGGMNATHVERCLVLSRIARHSGAAAAILQASLIPAAAVRYWATEEQRQLWLPQIAAGTQYPAIAVTERGVGGTVLEIATSARRSNGEWVLDGEKCHVGNAEIAGLLVVIARTGKPGDGDEGTDTRDPRGLSAFLVEADRPGLEVVPAPLDGLRGFSASTVRLRGVRVPAGNLLGELGDGADIAHMVSLVIGRLNFAAMGVGLLEHLLDETFQDLDRKHRSTGTLLDNPQVRQQLAKVQSRLLTAEAVTLDAAQLLDSGAGCDERLCNAKLISVDEAREGAKTAFDLAGGAGNHPDHTVNRLQADVEGIVHPAGPPGFQLHRILRYVLGRQPVQWSALYTRRCPSRTREPAHPHQSRLLTPREHRDRQVPA